MIYCFDVTVTVVVIDTLEKSSALVVGKMKNPQTLMVFGKLAFARANLVRRKHC